MEGTFLCLREARRRLKALSLIAPASDLENFARGKKRKRGKKKNPSGMKTRFGQQLRVEISFIYIYTVGGIRFAIAGAEKNTIFWTCAAADLFNARTKSIHIIISPLSCFSTNELKGMRPGGN